MFILMLKILGLVYQLLIIPCRERDPEIELKNTERVQEKMSKYETGKSSNVYLKNIKYKGALVPFKYCTLCLKVLRGMWAGHAKRYVKLGDDGHECVNALENMSKIYAEERSR